MQQLTVRSFRVRDGLSHDSCDGSGDNLGDDLDDGSGDDSDDDFGDGYWFWLVIFLMRRKRK